ncbi:hypothetical protein SLA2020_464490 [Shorea laevis]
MTQIGYLHKVFISKVASKAWRPFKVSRGGLSLSHLFFADDLMLFGEASAAQLSVIMNCLKDFAAASGLEINLHKSKLYVSPNIQGAVANSLCSQCGIPLSATLGTYLGVPILHGRVTPNTYKCILEKMQKKLAGWKRNTLSLAGRRTLVQAVTSAIPTYTMQTILLPKTTCAAIDTLNRKFLWGSDEGMHKPNLVSWEVICSDKNKGGLGIRMAQDHNRSLIAKLGWRLLSGDTSPWCQALQLKYLRHDSLMTATGTARASAIWRSILHCRDILELGMEWRIGMGENVNFWTDKWVASSPLSQFLTGSWSPEALHMRVSEAIKEGQQWNHELLHYLLPPPQVEEILAIPLSSEDCLQDKIIWKANAAGSFSVASAYHLIQDNKPALPLQDRRWKWIWKLECPERVRMFVWLLLRNRVMTNSVRYERHLTDSTLCPRCGSSQESSIHLLRDCYYARQVWELMVGPSRGFFHQPDFPKRLEKNATLHRKVPLHDIEHSILFLCIIWMIWKCRNQLVFEHQHIPPVVCFEKARRLTVDTQTAIGANILVRRRELRWINWKPPDRPFLKLNTDGSLDQNSGKATAGGLLRDCVGSWIQGFSVTIGKVSILMAELWGCREGLKLCKELGVTHLIIEMDSQVAVNAICSGVDMDNHAAILVADIRKLLLGFTSSTVQHILREGNSAADFMASVGYTLPIGTSRFAQPPVGVEDILLGDRLGVPSMRP